MGDVINLPAAMPRWRQLLFEALEVPHKHWGKPSGEIIAFAYVLLGTVEAEDPDSKRLADIATALRIFQQR